MGGDLRRWESGNHAWIDSRERGGTQAAFSLCIHLSGLSGTLKSLQDVYRLKAGALRTGLSGGGRGRARARANAQLAGGASGALQGLGPH